MRSCHQAYLEGFLLNTSNANSPSSLQPIHTASGNPFPRPQLPSKRSQTEIPIAKVPSKRSQVSLPSESSQANVPKRKLPGVCSQTSTANQKLSTNRKGSGKCGQRWTGLWGPARLCVGSHREGPIGLRGAQTKLTPMPGHAGRLLGENHSIISRCLEML